MLLDDLDRCLPETVVALIEAMKLPMFASPRVIKRTLNHLEHASRRLNDAALHRIGVHLEPSRGGVAPDLHAARTPALLDGRAEEADTVVLALWNAVDAGEAAVDFARAFARWREDGSPRLLVYRCEGRARRRRGRRGNRR